ncbi:hypothetical protein C0Q70_19035 [Pomacea canaliculata]|uniref:AN1-type domain-containing protein n=1 Tax=Pomacea canaliculata TaxID=400727 RepID=A0A2T7NI98_POMCA|nr:hypothetical protein C0Q70_19035 [Pomacea canaliculata]
MDTIADRSTREELIGVGKAVLLNKIAKLRNGRAGKDCLKHQSKVSHDCSKSLLVSSSGQYTGCPAYNCNLPGCPKRELVPVLCEHCHLNFCLSHRHQQDHICSQIKKELDSTATAPQRVSQILGQCKGQKKSFKTARSREMAAKVALMKLKAQANGDCSIPETERVFFLVFMPLSHGHPPKALFFSKRWTVGRITDLIADKAGITNLNNTSSNMKLRLFIQDNGKVLSSDQVLADLLDGDQGVFNGGSLIMETVPADLLVLPDTHLYDSGQK